jgi:hypothetical protein
MRDQDMHKEPNDNTFIYLVRILSSAGAVGYLPLSEPFLEVAQRNKHAKKIEKAALVRLFL